MVGGDADGDREDAVTPGDTLDEDLAGLLPPRIGRCAAAAAAVSGGGGGTSAAVEAAALDGGGGGGGGGGMATAGGTLWWSRDDGGDGGSTGAVVGGTTSGGAMSTRCRLCTDSVASQFWKGAGVWYSAGSDGGRKCANGLIGKNAWPGVSRGIAAAAAAAELM